MVYHSLQNFQTHDIEIAFVLIITSFARAKFRDSYQLFLKTVQYQLCHESIYP